jgi:hypothetical protein
MYEYGQARRHTEPAEGEAIMAEAFSQQFCSVAPCGVGGRIITGQRLQNCLVRVADGELALIQAPATLIAKGPAANIRIVTPPAIRKIGTAVILQVGGDLLAVEFDGVYRRQQSHEKSTAKRRSPFTNALRQVFSISDIMSAPKAMRLGRELARECTTALLAAGAVDNNVSR